MWLLVDNWEKEDWPGIYSKLKKLMRPGWYDEGRGLMILAP